MTVELGSVVCKKNNFFSIRKMDDMFFILYMAADNVFYKSKIHTTYNFTRGTCHVLFASASFFLSFLLYQ